jgi:hypothetical protein
MLLISETHLDYKLFRTAKLSKFGNLILKVRFLVLKAFTDRHRLFGFLRMLFNNGLF